MTLEFDEAPLHEVMETIGAAGDLRVRYDEKIQRDAPISVSLTDVTVLDALRFVTRANRLFFLADGTGGVVIAPDTRQKRQELMPRHERVFRLEHAAPGGVVTVLRSILQARQLVVDAGPRTVTMGDTDDQIELAEILIERIDRPDASSVSAADRDPIWAGTGFSHGLGSPADPLPRLEVDLSAPVTLGDGPLTAGRLYATVGDATGIEFLFHHDFDRGQPVAIDSAAIPAGDALAQANAQTGAFAVTWGPRTMFVAPDDHQRRAAEAHEAIRFFYLTEADTRSVVTALRAELQMRQVAEIPRLNAVIIRDDVPRVEAAQEIVARLDTAERR